MSSQRAQTCSTMPSNSSPKFTQISLYLLVSHYQSSLCYINICNVPEFDAKRQNAVSTHERLQQEAQAVLDVIENPDVAQALRQDKNQNLQYLKDNYNVRCDQRLPRSITLIFFIAHPRANHCTLQLWSIPIFIRKLQRSCRLSIPFPRPLHR